MKTLRAALALIVLALPVAFAATRPSPERRAEDLLQAQVALWEDPDARARTVAELRALNPEWDFMRRTFLGLALVDRALAAPEEADRWLPVVDELLASLVADEARLGQEGFLLPYARRAPFRDPAGRSVFVDGEIALLAGARRMVREDPATAALHRERVAHLQRSFAAHLLPESYPDEGWTFCMTNALVALRLADALDGTDHAPLVRAWVHEIGALAEPDTGLLPSSLTPDGRVLDGPEGSSIWLVAANLALLDPDLAQRQYAGAREGLFHALLGLGWASEWGPGWRGPVDVDSGPIVPLFDASPSSSGFALLAARAFGDDRTFDRLARSLHAADLLVAVDPRMATLADNPMGDVIVLHALTFGPLWEEARARLSGS